VSPPAGTAVAVAPRALPWRAWIAFSASLLAACGLLLWAAAGTPGHPRLAVLSTLLLYTSVACTFLPLPTAWIVLWAAREAGPLPVALVATVGTCVANLHDYYIVSGLCRLGRVQRARRSRSYARAVGWFQRAPFLALAAASFVPISVDAVRLLAISAGYPRRAYVLASFAGRFPRYLLLAVLGHELRLSNRAIAAVLVAMALVGLGKGALHLLQRRRAPAGAEDRAGP
jgi:membrane protein YqaA with SNARE-associated domain